MNSRFIKSVQAFSLRPSVMIFCLLAGSAVGTAFPVLASIWPWSATYMSTC